MSSRHRALNLSLTGLVVLAVVTAVVAVLALLQYRGSAQSATPVTSSAPASTESEPADTPVSPQETEASETAEPTAAETVSPELAQFAAALTGGDSVMVFGDGTGNDDGEWVSLWAQDYLAKSRATDYVVWDRDAAVWGAPMQMSSSGNPLTVWNASVRSPEITTEPDRVVQAWQPANAVILSYGHVQTADTIAGYMQSILDAVRLQSPEVPVAVVLQNPDPSATAAQQDATVAAIAAWAEGQGLAIIDVHSGFPQDQASRDNLLEIDGTPNAQGSGVFASVVANSIPLG
ncbi:SGNH/GDSL hydrolase family protein [Propionimicrobium sp. PCR01-08-3]|uniref:SGNH/GDSL hydrolase family protein n=1 Tax=Propionimicrobium sp. PCR01-08-3 TaxID=3052086 RepID=UPI00255CFB15|nr:SGNH/GDSL hydrolase family protein [Propionimicrobium sp. PCR01-08-3]WIY83007.1 SGNH/GDSL hydrolase family protein [Propionimicrobium sp. PCR01-08-3]